MKRIIKKVLFFLPILIMLLVLRFVLSSFTEDVSMTDKEFAALYVWACFIAGLILLVFFYGPYFLIKVISNYTSKREQTIREIAIKREQEISKRKDEENRLRKMKYKRIKCPYCGTNNMLTAVTCVSCGAPVQSDQSQFLDM